MDGSLKWAVDVKLPGMVHARNVKPPVAGATLVSIDESSVRSIPGFVKVVSKGNYVAVVCEREEQAIRAARQLKVNWQKPATAPFPTSEDLFKYMRARDADLRAARRPSWAIPTRRSPAPRRSIEAEYDVPFQGHTAIGPAHAMADPSNDQLTIYSNDMKSYGLRNGVAQFLEDAARSGARGLDGRPAGLRPHRGRRCRVRGGVSGEGDRAAGARAVDARRKKRPGTRRARPTPFKMRGGLDAQGNLVALDYEARAADHNHLGYNEPDTVLIAQLTGMRRATPARGRASTPSDMYVDPEPAHDRRTSSACRSCGRRRCAPATCAIPTVRR